jgi:hypothetical protein
VTELPLTKAVIGRLALEADLHHVKIDELVSKLVINTMKKGLLQLVLRKPRRSGSNLT